MKKRIVIPQIVFFILLVSACQNLSVNQEALVVPKYREASLYETSLTADAQKYLYLLKTATVYEGELEFDSSYRVIRGELRIYYINNEETPFSEIYLRLFPNYNGGEYHIEGIWEAGENSAWGYESGNTAVRVDLPEPLSPGEELTLMISFSLSIPEGMGGNYDTFGYSNEILALDNMLPVIPVYDEHGWHIDPPAKNGDLPFVDPSFVHLEITAPEELEIVSSGIETKIGQDQEAKTQTVEILAGPIRDFYLTASPLYTVKSINIGETTINSYSLSGDETQNDLVLELGSNALTVFGARLGAYPYVEFDIVASSVGTAMEYPGIIAIGLDKYGLKEDPFGRSPSELMPIAVVHETAHQWFYNMVGDDQVNHPWLDESFAMYLTHLYFVEIDGSAWEFDNTIGKSWNRINRAEIPIGLAVTEYSTNEYSPIVYARGQMFLQTLEYELGGELFAQTLKEYFQANIWKNVGPENLKLIAESKCECDLSELWQEWVLP